MANFGSVPKNRSNLRQEYTTKAVLTLIFFIILFVFLWWARSAGKELESFRLSFLEVTLIGIATVRLGRLVAHSHVLEPIRAPFTATVPDETGAGKTVVARGTGIRYAIGQLISCPICVGTWCAALLVYGLYVIPGTTLIFLYMTAAIGIAEILNALIEALNWSGKLTRTQTGERRNNK